MLVTVLSILATFLFLGLIALILVIIIYNYLHGLLNRCTNSFRQLGHQLRHRSELIAQLIVQLEDQDPAAGSDLKHLAKQCESVEVLREKIGENLCDEEEVVNWVHGERELRAAVAPLLSKLASSAAIGSETDAAATVNELTATAGRIAFATEAFDDFVGHYNHGRTQFPTKILASRLGFREIPSLEPHTQSLAE